jgi:hypothetical protein
MIVIKIKTWKDWKKDFIDWVQAPRRKTCKEYVNYMESLSYDAVEKAINKVWYKHSNMTDSQIEAIAEAVEECIGECAKKTCKLIDDCQPIKFF